MGIIYTVMEAAKGMPYRLAWQGILSCELYCQRQLREESICTQAIIIAQIAPVEPVRCSS
jgi:hypothetical protein